MSLVVQVSVNGVEIERIECARREPFDGDVKDYTYDVQYHRQQEHRTSKFRDAHVVVHHAFHDGSLWLLRNALSALLGMEE